MVEERVIEVEKIRQMNFDLADRMEEEGITLYYNPEGDVLSVIIGEPWEALTEPMVDDIMYRIDPESLKVVGFEVISFLSDVLRHNKIVRKMVKAAFPELLSGQEQTIQVAEARQRRQVEALLTGIT